MTTPIQPPNIPSRQLELLAAIRGQRLVRLVRYSWLPAPEAAAEYGLRADELFWRTAGPLVMSFARGLVVGASSDPAQGSIVLWVERNEAGVAIPDATADDNELYPIDAVGSGAYLGGLLGRSVMTAEILRTTPTGVRQAELPNEAGLLLLFDGSEDLVLGHGLHDGSDDFAVLRLSEIRAGLVPSVQPAGDELD